MPIPEKISSNATYAGLHWARRKKVADLYHSSMLQFRKLKVTEYPVEISYVFTFKRNPLDSTNCGTMAKLVEDGMVRCGILEDDDWKHVTSTTLHTQKGDKDLIEIYIT